MKQLLSQAHDFVVVVLMQQETVTLLTLSLG